jgi:hypothetical protein
MTLRSTIIVALFALISGPSVAQESLCDSSEQTVWSCTTKAKIYSLCAPKSGNPEKTYLQYRVGTPTRTELIFPSFRRPPTGVFRYLLYNTTASVQFENAGYQYAIYETINGKASIEVTKRDRTVASIQCDASTDTLTLTSTIGQFKDMGIYE